MSTLNLLEEEFKDYIRSAYRQPLSKGQLTDLKVAFAAGMMTHMKVFRRIIERCDDDEEMEKKMVAQLGLDILEWIKPCPDIRITIVSLNKDDNSVN